MSPLQPLTLTLVIRIEISVEIIIAVEPAVSYIIAYDLYNSNINVQDAFLYYLLNHFYVPGFYANSFNDFELQVNHPAVIKVKTTYFNITT